MQRERERESEIWCFLLSSLNECTLTSLGRGVTGHLHKMHWKMALLSPIFLEKRDGSGNMTKLRGIECSGRSGRGGRK